MIWCSIWWHGGIIPAQRTRMRKWTLWAMTKASWSCRGTEKARAHELLEWASRLRYQIPLEDKCVQVARYIASKRTISRTLNVPFDFTIGTQLLPYHVLFAFADSFVFPTTWQGDIYRGKEAIDGQVGVVNASVILSIDGSPTGTVPRTT